ncbi:MAG: dienelactone hydrolase family protein [Nitrososphaerota archaeon]|nr:dienelactone hydrolase family protein [Nitrososphaerota archaeon]
MSQLESGMTSFKGPEHEVRAYLTRPAGSAPLPGLVLIHEIWGLTPHIRDVADRFAREGFVVLAPDLMGSDPAIAPLFSEANVEAVMRFMFTLPPGKMRDQAFVQEELARLPQDQRTTVGTFFGTVFAGKLPFPRFAQELSAAYEDLKARGGVDASRIGSLGFCFGGTMSFKLACTGVTQACVVFYGQNPDPLGLVEKINCPVLCNYGAEDGLNATLDQLVGAMVRYKKDFEMRIYSGAAHAFFNDDNQYMYKPIAARQAWALSLDFLKRNLGEH